MNGVQSGRNLRTVSVPAGDRLVAGKQFSVLSFELEVAAMAAFEDIKKVGVIGAGTMGRGIVMNFVNAGSGDDVLPF